MKIIKDREVYGYEIAERLKGFGLEDVSEGTIYPLLLRLEKGGLLNSVKKESPYGPKRKYYTLTNKGLEELKEFYRDWLILSKSINNIFYDMEE